MNRLLCYAHFDEIMELKPYVRHSITSMSQVCSDMLFVSNSQLGDTDKEFLLSICKRVVINKNTGYDFSMWKTALQLVNYMQYDEVVLMNSSVYGPITPIEPIFAEMEARDCDFWGITECFQRQPHLQSYFLVFGKKVIASPAFATFWNGVLPYRNKLQVIMSYEIALTLWLRESGFRMDVYRGLSDLAPYCYARKKRIRKNDNVTLKYPEELLASGSPFLKKELISKGIFDVESLRLLLSRNIYPLELFDNATPDASLVCPLCGVAGRVRYRGVRDYCDLYNTERYDYCQCTARDCGAIWRSNLAVFYQGHTSGARCSMSDGTTIFCNEQELADMDKELIVHIDLLDELGRSNNPRQLLSECRRLLQAGGTLTVNSPNAEAFLLLLFRSYWYGLDAPRRSTIFTRKSLFALLKSTGFSDIHISAPSTDSKKYTLQSLNIALTKWTYPGLYSIAGFEFIQSLVDVLCFFVATIASNRGAECRAVAKKAT